MNNMDKALQHLRGPGELMERVEEAVPGASIVVEEAVTRFVEWLNDHTVEQFRDLRIVVVGVSRVPDGAGATIEFIEGNRT